MARTRAMAIIVCLALAVWGTAPAAADLASATVSSTNHYFSIAYWENIIEAISQPGGFCQDFNVQEGEHYTLRVDLAGQDPGIDALEVQVAGKDCIYELAAFSNTPIILPFAAEQATETLKMAPYFASAPVPVPPGLLLLGSGLIGLAILRCKAKGFRRLFRFLQP